MNQTQITKNKFQRIYIARSSIQYDEFTNHKCPCCDEKFAIWVNFEKCEKCNIMICKRCNYEKFCPNCNPQINEFN